MRTTVRQATKPQREGARDNDIAKVKPIPLEAVEHQASRDISLQHGAHNWRKSVRAATILHWAGLLEISIAMG